MKKLVLAASIALLTACSAPQQSQINVNPQAALSQNAIVNNSSFSLVSKDVRSAQYVALVDSGRNNIEPIHPRQNVRITLENAWLNSLDRKVSVSASIVKTPSLSKSKNFWSP